jgi:hypothetical protein
MNNQHFIALNNMAFTNVHPRLVYGSKMKLLRVFSSSSHNIINLIFLYVYYRHQIPNDQFIRDFIRDIQPFIEMVFQYLKTHNITFRELLLFMANKHIEELPSHGINEDSPMYTTVLNNITTYILDPEN